MRSLLIRGDAWPENSSYLASVNRFKQSPCLACRRRFRRYFPRIRRMRQALPSEACELPFFLIDPVACEHPPPYRENGVVAQRARLSGREGFFMKAHQFLTGAVCATALLAAGCTCFHRSPPAAVVSSSPVCCTPPGPGCAEPVPGAPVPVAPYAPPPPANIGGIPR